MNKKLLVPFAALLVLVFALGLTGAFALAKDEVPAKQADRLVGVLVTKEHLDLFDMDAFFADHAGAIARGEDVDAGGEQYQGRYYATLEETPVTDEYGETHLNQRYVFEGIDGFLLIAAKYHQDENDLSYLGFSGDDGVEIINSNHTVSDSGQSIDMEGTIYLDIAGATNRLFFNAVYQSPDGEVYTTVGQGMQMDPSMDSTCSSSLGADTTITTDGKEETFHSNFKFNVTFVATPQSTRVLQFNKEHEVIFDETYAAGELPESLMNANGCAYLLVESTGLDAKGKEVLTREYFTTDADSISALMERGDGICIKQYCTLEPFDGIVSNK